MTNTDDLVELLHGLPKSTVIALEKILKNVIQNPKNETFKRIKKNEFVKNHIMTHENAVLILVVAGFESNDSEFVLNDEQRDSATLSLAHLAVTQVVRCFK